MGVPGSEGGDDFLDGGDRDEDGDGDDFIDATAEDVQAAPPPAAASTAASSSSSASSSAPPVAAKRRIRIKPMPAALAAKWPKVVSMFIVMNDGTQLLLVKG